MPTAAISKGFKPYSTRTTAIRCSSSAMESASTILLSPWKLHIWEVVSVTEGMAIAVGTRWWVNPNNPSNRASVPARHTRTAALTMFSKTPNAGQVSYPHLFSPITIGRVQLENRIAMLPIGTGLPRDGIVNEADIAWHEERARGGVGLIIAGGTTVHPTAVLRPNFNDAIDGFSEAGLENQRRKVAAVHQYGTKIFCQGVHVGRDLVGGQTESALLAPSAVRSPRQSAPPRAIDRDEIPGLVAAFVRSAELFVQAGYDGVEIGAHHGHLIALFLSVTTNRRADEYGPTSQ